MIRCIFEHGNEGFLRHAVVDVLVLKDNKLLLVKRTAKLLEGGKWALIGGFMERDETLEEAVKREILEESGWEVEDVNLLRVIDSPKRRNEDRQNVSFVYVCTATQKVGEPDWESDDQRWFGWDELPALEEIAFDHADIIAAYRET